MLRCLPLSLTYLKTEWHSDDLHQTVRACKSNLHSCQCRYVGCILHCQHNTGVGVRQAPMWSVHLDELKRTKRLPSCHILSFASKLVLLLQAEHVTSESSDQPVSNIRHLKLEKRAAQDRQACIVLRNCRFDDPADSDQTR